MLPRAVMQAKIASLEAAFAEAVAKKEALAQQVADCTAKLQRADKLIGGLGGERVRPRYRCSISTLPRVAMADHFSEHRMRSASHATHFQTRRQREITDCFNDMFPGPQEWCGPVRTGSDLTICLSR